MTSTERSRRYIASLRKRRAEEIDALKARVAELEAEVARLEKSIDVSKAGA
jgi:hypothetical protein